VYNAQYKHTILLSFYSSATSLSIVDTQLYINNTRVPYPYPKNNIILYHIPKILLPIHILHQPLVDAARMVFGIFDPKSVRESCIRIPQTRRTPLQTRVLFATNTPDIMPSNNAIDDYSNIRPNNNNNRH
jgi:hypothetical protein